MSEEVKTTKQAVGGFKINTFNIKKTKDGEKIKLVLEASVEDLASGTYDVGDVMNALTNHMTGDSEVGLSLFIKK